MLVLCSKRPCSSISLPEKSLPYITYGGLLLVTCLTPSPSCCPICLFFFNHFGVLKHARHTLTSGPLHLPFLDWECCPPDSLTSFEVQLQWSLLSEALLNPLFKILSSPLQSFFPPSVLYSSPQHPSLSNILCTLLVYIIYCLHDEKVSSMKAVFCPFMFPDEFTPLNRYSVHI